MPDETTFELESVQFGAEPVAVFRFGYERFELASQPFHWVGGIGWGGQRLFVFPALDRVVAINCGNYRKPGPEQGRVNGVVLTEVVLPSFV